jgi:hypothetical protein
MKNIRVIAKTLDRSTVTTLAEVSQELASWVPVLKQLAEAEALRNLAHGYSFEITSGTVRSIIAARRLRSHHFYPSISEDAWEVLLQLLAARLSGHRLDIRELNATSEFDADAALRTLEGIAPRFVTRKTGDTQLVDLTDEGVDRLRTYLLAALSLSPWVA